MKTFTNQAAQGDILIRKIATIPSDAIKQDTSNGIHVVAHSETGHHHVIDAEDVEYYQDGQDKLTAYLVVQSAIGKAIRHLRSFHTHEPITVPPGIYEIRRQREYTPSGWRRAAD